MEGNTIKLRGVAQEQGLVGQEVTVAANATSVSLAAYSFDTLRPDPVDPTLEFFATGVTVGWVSGGQVFVQRYQLVNDATGHPSAFVAAGIDGQVDPGALHDPADIVPASDAALALGAGRDVKVQNTHLGDTLVVWVDGTNQLRANLYPPNGVVVPSDNTLNGLTAAEYTAVNTLLDAAGTLGAIPADATPQVMELGAGDFAIVWKDAAGNLQIRVFALPPDTAAGDGLPDGWSFYTTSIPANQLVGFTGEFALTGFGEDNGNLVITYTAEDIPGSNGVYARVVDMTAIDGTPNSISVSAPVLVNTDTAGNQSLTGVTGLISDRFMVSYVDDDGVIQSRILDTRAPDQFLVGDQIRDRNTNGVLDNGDRVRSRPDIIVGTNGNDVVIADLVDPNINGVRFDGEGGSEDEIYGGMGRDVIFGGGGFDILDGGLDLATDGRDETGRPGVTSESYTDTAIFQGSFINYNVFINGDGSYSILDARFDDGANIIDELDDGHAEPRRLGHHLELRDAPVPQRRPSLSPQRQLCADPCRRQHGTCHGHE